MNNEIVSFEIETFPVKSGLIYWAKTTTGKPVRNPNGKKTKYEAIILLYASM